MASGIYLVHVHHIPHTLIKIKVNITIHSSNFEMEKNDRKWSKMKIEYLDTLQTENLEFIMANVSIMNTNGFSFIRLKMLQIFVEL